jgi:hypothetical protein
VLTACEALLLGNLARTRARSTCFSFDARLVGCDAGSVELLTLEDFREAVRHGRIIVITDVATGNRAHDPECSFVTQDHFAAKVLESQARNGRCFAVDSVWEARREHGAAPCAVCSST